MSGIGSGARMIRLTIAREIAKVCARHLFGADDASAAWHGCAHAITIYFFYRALHVAHTEQMDRAARISFHLTEPKLQSDSVPRTTALS